jgi:hypothetical protein
LTALSWDQKIADVAAAKRSKARIIFPLSSDFKHSEMRTISSLQSAEIDCRDGRDFSPYSQAERG